MIGAVVGKSPHLISEQGDAVHEAWTTTPTISWDSMGSIGIFVFAYCIGSNVPSIACEMADVTVNRAVIAALASNLMMCIVYLAIGMCGYLSFVSSPNFVSAIPAAAVRDLILF